MAAGRYNMRSTAPAQWQLAAAAFVAANLIFAFTGEAFLAPSRPASLAQPVSIAGQPRPAGVRSALGVKESDTSSSSMLKVAASVALLCVAASKTYHSKASKISKKAVTVHCARVVRFDHTALHALPDMGVPVATSTVHPQASAAMGVHMTVDNLIETSNPPASPELPSFAVEDVFTVAAAAAPVIPAPEVAIRAQATPVAARLVGGVRRPSISYKSRTSRTARHATGRRLVERSEHQAVPDLAFDASRITTKIQLGLRNSSSRCIQPVCESTMAFGPEGSEVSYIVNFVPAHDIMIVFFNLKLPSSPCGSQMPSG
eukprot:CAMPEP_0197622832 /NCGR_PEP_ID=MMETSP1338-20131121/2961_1 /TAXON_ID=43686 ORGANISM="Pelagodinium beii, Strain RCC1491" /NCGR_SAMPLE_ID=MMETSP1338 /ASSEMBLY_ACC=CAM_ASM_000754 /LENGTH=315 /DNA_ID=CAMNT_0043192591 /DNA_START=34 /DNA_END=978 /DNA_ORIENTATION=+